MRTKYARKLSFFLWCGCYMYNYWGASTTDVMLAEKVWEPIQKHSRYETASNAFQSKTWKTCGNAVPTRSHPATPLDSKHTGLCEPFWSIRLNCRRSSKCCTYCKQRCAAVLAHTHGCHIKKRNGKPVMHQKIS